MVYINGESSTIEIDNYYGYIAEEEYLPKLIHIKISPDNTYTFIFLYYNRDSDYTSAMSTGTSFPASMSIGPDDYKPILLKIENDTMNYTLYNLACTKYALFYGSVSTHIYNFKDVASVIYSNLDIDEQNNALCIFKIAGNALDCSDGNAVLSDSISSKLTLCDTLRSTHPILAAYLSSDNNLEIKDRCLSEGYMSHTTMLSSDLDVEFLAHALYKSFIFHSNTASASKYIIIKFDEMTEGTMISDPSSAGVYIPEFETNSPTTFFKYDNSLYSIIYNHEKNSTDDYSDEGFYEYHIETNTFHKVCDIDNGDKNPIGLNIYPVRTENSDWLMCFSNSDSCTYIYEIPDKDISACTKMLNLISVNKDIRSSINNNQEYEFGSAQDLIFENHIISIDKSYLPNYAYGHVKIK